MKVPGFLWTALLALIPLLIEWLQGDYFGAQKWVSVAIIVLGFAAKLIEVYRLQHPDEVTAREVFAEGPPSKSQQFWLG